MNVGHKRTLKRKQKKKKSMKKKKNKMEKTYLFDESNLNESVFGKCAGYLDLKKIKR